MSQRKRRNASALLLLAALLCADGLAENEAVAAAGGDTRSPETAAAQVPAAGVTPVSDAADGAGAGTSLTHSPTATAAATVDAFAAESLPRSV